MGREQHQPIQTASSQDRNKQVWSRIVTSKNTSPPLNSTEERRITIIGPFAMTLGVLCCTSARREFRYRAETSLGWCGVGETFTLHVAMVMFCCCYIVTFFNE